MKFSCVKMSDEVASVVMVGKSTASAKSGNYLFRGRDGKNNVALERGGSNF